MTDTEVTLWIEMLNELGHKIERGGGSNMITYKCKICNHTFLAIWTADRKLDQAKLKLDYKVPSCRDIAERIGYRWVAIVDQPCQNILLARHATLFYRAELEQKKHPILSRWDLLDID